MSIWKHKYCSLDKLGKISRGRSQHRPRNAPQLYGGIYPFIQTADITNSRLCITKYKQTYSEQGLAQSRLWEPETLCIVNAGVNTGDNAILTFRACFPDSVIGFIADPKKSDVRFVKYCLDSIKVQIKSITMGATQDNLSVSKLLTFKLPNIDLEDQKIIAAILSAYDDLIEINKKRIEHLEKMAEEIYREWFVRMRFPGHEKAKYEKGVPVDWLYRPIDEVVKFLSGYSFKSEKYIVGGKYNVVTIKNVHDGYFVRECSDSIDEPPSNMKKHCYLEDGDILMSLTGNVGRVCRVTGERYLLNQRVAKLKPLIPKSESFVYWFFRQKSIQTLTELISTGAAQQNLSPIKLGNQKVFVPTDELIAMFEEKTLPINNLIMSISRANQMLLETRELLLPRLISGKLSVENLDIQFPPSMQQETESDTEPEREAACA